MATDHAADCGQAHYSAGWVRFALLHHEAYMAAYLAPDPRTSQGELERLDWSWRHRPMGRGHLCSCHCPRERASREGVACRECLDLRRMSANVGVRVATGRTAPAHPPMPPTWPLDWARARAAGHRSAGEIARFLNGGR